MHALDSQFLAVLALGPRATRSDVASVRRWIHGSIERGARLLVVDLSDAAYVDSHVLAALVDGVRAADEAGADLVLAAPRTSVCVILELTRLHTVFDVFETVDDATRVAPAAMAA